MEDYNCFANEERHEDSVGMSKREKQYFELCGKLTKREKSIEAELTQLGAFEDRDSDEDDNRNYYDGGSPSESDQNEELWSDQTEIKAIDVYL